MVPSFFIFTPLLYSCHIGYGKWHGTLVKPNTLPPIESLSLFGLSLYKGLFTWRGHFPKRSKKFFEKNENLFSIRKCIGSKSRKAYLGPRLAKLFFTVIFQIYVLQHQFLA